MQNNGILMLLRRTGNPKSRQIHLGHAGMKMTVRYLLPCEQSRILRPRAKLNLRGRGQTATSLKIPHFL